MVILTIYNNLICPNDKVNALAFYLIFSHYAFILWSGRIFEEQYKTTEFSGDRFFYFGLSLSASSHFLLLQIFLCSSIKILFERLTAQNKHLSCTGVGERNYT